MGIVLQDQHHEIEPKAHCGLELLRVAVAAHQVRTPGPGFERSRRGGGSRPRAALGRLRHKVDVPGQASMIHMSVAQGLFCARRHN